MDPKLVEAIAERRCILFVGAGLSASLGAPTWRKLIDHMAEELGYHPRVLAPPDVNYLALAEYFSLEKKDGIMKLCERFASQWDANIDALKKSSVLRSIYELDFPIIYTTNYDHNIEKGLREFGGSPVVVRSISDLPSAFGADQVVVKFHGDLSKPESLILTESSYFDRLTFESPLDLKLRSDVLGNSILFIGYSLSDINVRMLLYRLSKMWKDVPEEIRPRSFILLQRPNEMQRTVLGSWGVDVLVHDVDNPVDMLPLFLKELQSASRSRPASSGKCLP